MSRYQIKNRLAGFAAVIAVTAFIGCATTATNTQPMPEKISFPHGYDKGVLYQTVNRPDVKQVRELYASADTIKSIRDGKGAASGTVLTMVLHNATTNSNGELVKGNVANIFVMEKRRGWGAALPAGLRNGEWEYAAFTADGKPNEKANANIKACFECHTKRSAQDFMFSSGRM